MSYQVSRPEAQLKRISSKDEFELCYLRHQYIRRTTQNPTEQEMKPYQRIVENLARHTFFKYFNLFHMVGMLLEDVISICKTHLISFLGLFSMDVMPEKKQVFHNMVMKKDKRQPTDSDFLSKEKANLTMFLKQRMEDLVRVCRQKVRNIRGLLSEEFHTYYGYFAPPANLRHLVEDHEEFGYRKLDIGVFKSIKRKAKVRQNENSFLFDGKWYVAVPVEQAALGITDFVNADMSPYDNQHNMDPEQLLFCKLDEIKWEERKQEFNSKTNEDKISILVQFVERYKDQPDYREELRIAKRTLKSLGA